jgi:Peptidase M15
VTVPRRYRYDWNHPWSFPARHSVGFRRWLRRHGLLSPHFTIEESRSRNGEPVPRSLLGNAQRHAFDLEQLRHAVGDVPLPVLSWYRSPAYNRQVGGAPRSRHMSADATDFSAQTVNAVGRARFLAAADRVFADGGVGDYPTGSVHVDSRGWRARWRSFVPGR